MNSRNTPDTRQIRHRIQKVVADCLLLETSPLDLEEDGQLGELIGLDSIAMLEYVVALEKEFGITLSPDALRLELLADIRRLSEHLGLMLEPRDTVT